MIPVRLGLNKAGQHPPSPRCNEVLPRLFPLRSRYSDVMTALRAPEGLPLSL